MTRPLGDTQRHVLWVLAKENNGTWYPGAGWYWANVSTTIRIMDSLVNRGLATKTTEKARRTNDTYPVYKVTDEGRKQAGRPDVLPAKTRR